MQDSGLSGYFFMAFPQPALSLSVMKSVVIILVEKLKGFLVEIISRDRAAKEMQHVIAQYKVLFDRAPVLMNSFDKNNRCILWNGECERLFGWSTGTTQPAARSISIVFP